MIGKNCWSKLDFPCWLQPNPRSKISGGSLKLNVIETCKLSSIFWQTKRLWFRIRKVHVEVLQSLCNFCIGNPNILEIIVCRIQKLRTKLEINVVFNKHCLKFAVESFRCKFSQKTQTWHTQAEVDVKFALFLEVKRVQNNVSGFDTIKTTSINFWKIHRSIDGNKRRRRQVNWQKIQTIWIDKRRIENCLNAFHDTIRSGWAADFACRIAWDLNKKQMIFWWKKSTNINLHNSENCPWAKTTWQTRKRKNFISIRLSWTEWQKGWYQNTNFWWSYWRLSTPV